MSIFIETTTGSFSKWILIYIVVISNYLLLLHKRFSIWPSALQSHAGNRKCSSTLQYGTHDETSKLKTLTSQAIWCVRKQYQDRAYSFVKRWSIITCFAGSKSASPNCSRPQAILLTIELLIFCSARKPATISVKS